jgi:hypothetical protein
MDEVGTRRSPRWSELHAKLAEQHPPIISDNGIVLEELVAIIHDLDPIQRQRMWPADLIQYIVERQNWKCPACGKDIPPLSERGHHVDHIVPWSLGGGNEPANIQVLHINCNLLKGQRYDLDTLINYLRGRLFNIS